MRFRYGLLIASALLAACGQAVKVPPPPKTVTITVKEYVPVPSEFTKACPKAKPTNKTVAEAVRVARDRGAALDECNAQLEKIRNLPLSPTQTDKIQP